MRKTRGNASRKRQRNLGAPEPHAEPSGIKPLDLLVRDHRARIRPFGTPDVAAQEAAFRRALEEDDDDTDDDDTDDDNDNDSNQED